MESLESGGVEKWKIENNENEKEQEKTFLFFFFLNFSSVNFLSVFFLVK